MKSAGDMAVPSRSTRWEWSIAILLLAIHWGLAVSSVRDKSNTFDELVQVTRGYSYLATGDFRLGPPEPPLAHYFGALPGLFMDTAFPAVGDDPDWQASDPWKFGHRFLFESGNDPGSLLIRGRVSVALLSVALGLIVWRWSRRLFGPTGGLLSIVLYAFSPTILAHGRLVTTDLVAAFFFVASIGAIWRVLRQVNAVNLTLSILTVVGLLLSTRGGLLIVPAAAGLVVLRLLSTEPTSVSLGWKQVVRSRLRQTGVWAVVAVVHLVCCPMLIWAAYGFRYSTSPDTRPEHDGLLGAAQQPLPREPDSQDTVLAADGPLARVIGWTRDHRLLPEAYLDSLSPTVRGTQQRTPFLNGQSRERGWWYALPYCFVVKTPLPLLGLLGLAAGAVLDRARQQVRVRSGWKKRRLMIDGFYGAAPLWVLLLVYGLGVVAYHPDAGHPYLLPLYPVLFILAGAAGRWIEPPRSIEGAVVLSLAALFAGASLRAWPDYLAYFNLLVGGSEHGYRHLVDSSLDGGQDLPGLEARLADYRSQGRLGSGQNSSPIYLSYFGTSDPAHYGIVAHSLPSHPPRHPVTYVPLTGGVYCVSATTLQQVGLLPECRWTVALEAAYQEANRRLTAMLRRRAEGVAERSAADPTSAELGLLRKLRFARLCGYLRQRGPDDHVGYSILIYHLTDAEVRQALRGPTVELFADESDNLARLAEHSLHRGQFHAAATFFTFLLRLRAGAVDAMLLESVTRLGSGLSAAGHWERARQVYQAALPHGPRHPGLINNYAWLLATCPAEGVRDSEAALRLAWSAHELSGGGDPNVLDTLAAAFAEARRFDEALLHVGQAIELARQQGQTRLLSGFEQRAERYRLGQPWRTR